MWINNDGLAVRFGTEEAANVRGNEKQEFDNGCHVIEFDIKFTDAVLAYTILGDVTNSVDGVGSFGVEVPQGAVPIALEIYTETAFTSSGTIGTSVLSIGTKKSSDRSTELDHDGLTTVAFVGSRLDAVGERTYIEVAATGAGDDYGVAFAEQGLICVANTQHAAHPFTAGLARCRLHYRFN